MPRTLPAASGPQRRRTPGRTPWSSTRVVSKPVREVLLSSAGCRVLSVSCSSWSGFALLVVLESLGPGERLAFVRYDLCALPFDANGLAGVVSWREDGAASIRASPCSRRIPSTSASGSTTSRTPYPALSPARPPRSTASFRPARWLSSPVRTPLLVSVPCAPSRTRPGRAAASAGASDGPSQDRDRPRRPASAGATGLCPCGHRTTRLSPCTSHSSEACVSEP